MRPLALFALVLALGALILTSQPGVHAEEARHVQDAQQGGPIEIEKCQTIGQPGSYKLVDNLRFEGPANGTCLSITASFVTIDLAGFMITSNAIGGWAAIAAGADTTGITVRNGSLSGRVRLDGDGSAVEGLRIFGVGLGGIGISAKGIVRGNTVVGVSGPGPGNGVGISATGVIAGNYASSNRGGGIRAEAGSTVIGNTVTNTFDGAGMNVTCPSNVTDNTVTGGPFNLSLNGPGCNDTNNVAP